MMEFLIGVAVGIACGWVMFERPEWVRNRIDVIRNHFSR